MRYFFLTNGNEIRDRHMSKEFEDCNIKPVYAPRGGKHYSMSIGFSRILDLAAHKDFEPFTIFENDIKKTNTFTQDLIVPPDADLVYVGISTWGMANSNIYSGQELLYFENYDENYIKIQNMVSMHGIMICSIRGLLAYQRAMMESLYEDIPTDIVMAHIQPFLNVYALRKPIVYQCELVGGIESATNIEIENVENNIITPENINITHLTARCMYHHPLYRQN